MSNNLKFGLLGLVAVALIVNGYFLMKKSDNNTSSPANTENVADSASKEAADTKETTLKIADPAENPKKADDGKTVDPNMPKTTMTFEKMDHDYGKVEQQTKNEHIFRFTNSGTNPLVISKAKGTCGCTVPDYPKDPIMPGEDGEIKVEYSSRVSKGVQTKMVNIWANTEPEQTQLKITADVQAPAEEG